VVDNVFVCVCEYESVKFVVFCLKNTMKHHKQQTSQTFSKRQLRRKNKIGRRNKTKFELISQAISTYLYAEGVSKNYSTTYKINRMSSVITVAFKKPHSLSDLNKSY